jgi:hypothetical protein
LRERELRLQQLQPRGTASLKARVGGVACPPGKALQLLQQLEASLGHELSEERASHGQARLGDHLGNLGLTGTDNGFADGNPAPPLAAGFPRHRQAVRLCGCLFLELDAKLGVQALAGNVHASAVRLGAQTSRHDRWIRLHRPLDRAGERQRTSAGRLTGLSGRVWRGKENEDSRCQNGASDRLTQPAGEAESAPHRESIFQRR